jgi:hypothetical protein
MGFKTRSSQPSSIAFQIMKTCKPSHHLAIVAQEEVINYLSKYIFKLVEGILIEDCGLLGCRVQREPNISEEYTASIFRVEE